MNRELRLPKKEKPLPLPYLREPAAPGLYLLFNAGPALAQHDNHA